MKIIYAISGLAADHRVYQKIDFGPNTVIPLPWIKPSTNESLESYAKRMAADIRHEKPVLVGVSFGGMTAIEIAKHIGVEKIILISSAKTRAEIPALYKFCGAWRLQKLVPAWLIKNSKGFAARFFTARSKWEKELVDQMLDDTDPALLKWSMEKIMYWQNTSVPPNVYHIHGTKDRALPFANITCDKTVEGAGHLMIVNRAEEISAWLQDIVACESLESLLLR